MKNLGKITLAFILIFAIVLGNTSMQESHATESTNEGPSPLSGNSRASSEIQLINGNFEEPAISWGNYPGGYRWVNANGVPGWFTTDSKNEIEFFSKYQGGVTPKEGKQFVELNAHSMGELYQVLETTPGTRMRWSFYHRGRDGTDTMAVRIGPKSNPVEQQKIITPRSGWKYYTGIYTVPAGQTETYFGFASLSGKTTGNFMDDLRFSTMSDVGMKKSVSQSNGVYGDVLTYVLNLSNYGGTAANIIDLKDVLPTGVAFVPGSMTADGMSQSDALDGDLMNYMPGTRSVALANAIVGAGDIYEITFQARVTTLQQAIVTNLANATYRDYIDEGEVGETIPIKSNLVATNIKIKRSTITIKYEDEAGNAIALDSIRDENAGTSYNETAPNITNYTYQKTVGTPAGTVGGEDILIKFIYKRNIGKVIVSYLNTNTNLTADVELTGPVGDDYTTVATAFPGYILSNISGATSGVFTNSNISVTYYYILAPTAGVLIQHTNEAGNELIPATIQSGTINDYFTTSPKNIPLFTLKESPNPPGGFYSSVLQFRTYIYSRNQGEKITVKYVNEENEALVNAEERSGPLGNHYVTMAKPFANYTVKTIPTNAIGTYTNTEQEIIYVYKRALGAKVTVSYISTEGDVIAPEEILQDGGIGTTYISNELSIYGYELVTTPINASGIYTASEQQVTYVYRRAQSAIITVNYFDEDGNMVFRPGMITGLIGDTYQTIERRIYGYEVVGAPANESGILTDQPQSVTYIYRRIEGANVQVKYLDENGKSLIPDSILSGFLYEDYTTKTLNFSGYDLVSIPENANGEFESEIQEVIYKYKKIKTPTNPSEPIKPTKPGGSVQTGDSSNMENFMFIGLLSLLSIVMIGKKKYLLK